MCQSLARDCILPDRDEFRDELPDEGFIFSSFLVSILRDLADCFAFQGFQDFLFHFYLEKNRFLVF